MEARGGSVEKFIGDAVVASFAEPRDALEAGGAIIASVRALGDLDLAVRIGIATGEREDGEIPGLLFEVADRLQRLAGPHRLCLDEPTCLAVGGPAAESLPPMVLPGRPHPAPVYRLQASVTAARPQTPDSLTADDVEERKIVSVLFCDLFHLAALSHSADARDMRATERPSYARLKREIEAYGGTVEKFVGDALMAVFGAPVAREDDPERAVSAALRIVDTVREINDTDASLELGIRVAVNTGEVVADLSARPEEGEGIVTGDTVNTAARLLGVAPFGGVAVGPHTYEETSDAFEYAELDPVTVKGIPEPVPVFAAVKSRMAPLRRPAVEATFVGRGPELALLKGTYARVVHERQPQIIVLSGDPGQGKSRLLIEFRRFVDDQLELALWRQGRCRPFGEGMAFSPIAEVVKEHAGVLETDGAAEVEGKLRAALRALTSETDEFDWLAARVGPLVGADVPGAEARVERVESFAAWRRFLELVAQAQPLVLAVEDLHWADEAMLAFLEGLADARPAVPLLVVSTTRPDLYDREPDWAKRRDNVTHTALPPLGPDEQVRLLASLLPEGELPEETQAGLLERSGGNPLYTVELVRLLRDRGLLEEESGSLRLGAEAELALPGSVQAVIAARLDALAEGRKALLQDAAVVGRTFWTGALAALGTSETTESLADLVRRELVRPVPVSTVKGDEEFTFSHALVRDVAYGQLPRVPRVRKHRAMAAWVEELAGDRPEDRAEDLAHHYGCALELARAARLVESAELEGPARRAFVLAAERGMRLDVPAAQRHYDRALDLIPPDSDERGAILIGAARANALTGHEEQAVRLADDALAEFERAGDPVGTGEALLRRALFARDPKLDTIARQSAALLEPHGATAPLALAYEHLGSVNLYSEPRQTVEWTDKAIDICRQLGHHDELANAHSLRGRALFYLGENDAGLAELQKALSLCLERGLGYETVNAYGWLSVHTWLQDGPRKGLDLDDSAHDFARKRGVPPESIGVGARPRILFDLGSWDELTGAAGRRSASDAHLWASPSAHALLLRGGLEEARELAAQGVERFRSRAGGIGGAGLYAPALVVAALVEQARGDHEAAVGLVREAYDVTDVAWFWRAWLAHDASRILVAAGDVGLAASFVENTDPCDNRRRNCVHTGRAVLAEAAGKLEAAVRLYDEAAARWTAWGHPLEQGLAHLATGRCRIALGLAAEAGPVLATAKSVFEELRAEPLVLEAERLLEEAGPGPAVESEGIRR